MKDENIITGLGIGMCVIIVVVIVGLTGYINDFTAKVDATQNRVNQQIQSYRTQLENQGYTVRDAYFNSPSVTVTINSFAELEQKAQELNTTEIYQVQMNGKVGNYDSGILIATYYVIDSVAAYAWQYIPPYYP